MRPPEQEGGPPHRRPASQPGRLHNDQARDYTAQKIAAFTEMVAMGVNAGRMFRALLIESEVGRIDSGEGWHRRVWPFVGCPWCSLPTSFSMIDGACQDDALVCHVDGFCEHQPMIDAIVKQVIRATNGATR